MKKKILILLVVIMAIPFAHKGLKENYRTDAKFDVSPVPSHGGNQSRLTLHFFSSPHGVKWGSPRELFHSNLLNVISLKNRGMGHVAAEVHCLSPEGVTEYYNLTGMIDLGKNAFKKFFVEQLGFGVIFADYPGAMETPQSLQREIQAKQKEGRVHSVTFLIPQNSCLNLGNYIKEFKQEGVDQTYGGLTYEVRQKRRAGCAHFAYSLVDIANLESEPFLNGWERTVLIPKELVGGPLTGNKVSVFELFTSPHLDRWGDGLETSLKISFWDLDAIFNRLASSKGSEGILVKQHEKRKEFILDKTDVNDFETNYWLTPEKAALSH